MPQERKDLWELLRQEGEDIVTEADYEHRYQREIRHDLRQYIWFRVGQENYALALRDVAEIRKVFAATPVTAWKRPSSRTVHQIKSAVR